MKKQIILSLIAGTLLIWSSCTKSSSSTSSPNTLTIIDNGTSYTETGTPNGSTTEPSIYCGIKKASGNSSIVIIAGVGLGGVLPPVCLNGIEVTSPSLSGTGIYALADTPTG